MLPHVRHPIDAVLRPQTSVLSHWRVWMMERGALLFPQQTTTSEVLVEASGLIEWPGWIGITNTASHSELFTHTYYALSVADKSIIVRVKVIEGDKKRAEGPAAALLCHADLANLGIPVHSQHRVIARPYPLYYRLPEWKTAFACPCSKLT